jgi:hypothetical protein
MEEIADEAKQEQEAAGIIEESVTEEQLEKETDQLCQEIDETI